ncbi:retrotransposon protein, putative, ty1-copia subclass [Tanacetum coccineum]
MDRLPTRYNLDVRGIDLDFTRCPVCDGCVETSKHLFIDCMVARGLWKMISSWWKLDDYLKMSKRSESRLGELVDENVDMIVMVFDMCGMISEVNLVERVANRQKAVYMGQTLQLLISRVKVDRKDEAIDKFVLYKTKVENQFGKKIKVVRSDKGCEYVAPFAELCAKHEIRHEFTAPYLP